MNADTKLSNMISLDRLTGGKMETCVEWHQWFQYVDLKKVDEGAEYVPKIKGDDVRYPLQDVDGLNSCKSGSLPADFLKQVADRNRLAYTTHDGYCNNIAGATSR